MPTQLRRMRQQADAEAERPRPGLTMFTDGSRLDSGAAGYSVTRQSGQRWVGLRTHIGYNQEAYYAECAALATGIYDNAVDDLGQGHDLHGCLGRYQAHGLGKT